MELPVRDGRCGSTAVAVASAAAGGDRRRERKNGGETEAPHPSDRPCGPAGHGLDSPARVDQGRRQVADRLTVVLLHLVRELVPWAQVRSGEAQHLALA